METVKGKYEKGIKVGRVSIGAYGHEGWHNLYVRIEHDASGIFATSASIILSSGYRCTTYLTLNTQHDSAKKLARYKAEHPEEFAPKAA
jgi:hypothetical protein